MRYYAHFIQSREEIIKKPSSEECSRKANERSSLFSLLARVLPACLSQIHLTMRTGFCFFLTTDISISKTSILFASLAEPDGEFENFSIASLFITIA